DAEAEQAAAARQTDARQRRPLLQADEAGLGLEALDVERAAPARMRTEVEAAAAAQVPVARRAQADAGLAARHRLRVAAQAEAARALLGEAVALHPRVLQAHERRDAQARDVQAQAGLAIG